MIVIVVMIVEIAAMIVEMIVMLECSSLIVCVV